jgi:hypothetical protein
MKVHDDTSKESNCQPRKVVRVKVQVLMRPRVVGGPEEARKFGPADGSRLLAARLSLRLLGLS